MPEHLEDWLYFMNSVDWWRNHWERNPDIEVELAEALPNGWRLWLQWEEARDAAGATKRGPDVALDGVEVVLHHPIGELSEGELLRADRGRYMGFVRMVGRRKTEEDREG